MIKPETVSEGAWKILHEEWGGKSCRARVVKWVVEGVAKLLGQVWGEVWL